MTSLYKCIKNHKNHRIYEKDIIYVIKFNVVKLHGEWWHDVRMDVETFTGGGQVTSEFISDHFVKVK